MAVLQTGADGRHERLQQLSLLQLAQEAKSGAANELVRVLEVLKRTMRHVFRLLNKAHWQDTTSPLAHKNGSAVHESDHSFQVKMYMLSLPHTFL